LASAPLVGPRRARHTPGVSLYLPLLVVKFLGVLAYAGGLGARFLAEGAAAQKRAVHAVASPAIVVVWLAGWGLCELGGTSIGELWIVIGLLLSLASQLALVYGVARPVRPLPALLGALGPLLLVVLAMVYRPRWSDPW
jgi:hypothetical protein